MTKTVTAVTVGRSDYGILRPVLMRLRAAPGLQLRLIAAGTHMEPKFGHTVDEIEADGFEIAERIPVVPMGDAPADIAVAMAAAAARFAESYAAERPDILLLLGDRFEIFAAAAAALPYNIPVAHIHGGERTAGAFDDALRHALTKLSHIHFVAAEAYGRRVRQLGEADWRVHVCGAPALENIRSLEATGRERLEALLDCAFDPAPAMITYHPVTLEAADTASQTDALLAALNDLQRPLIFTRPNADTANEVIVRKIEAFVAANPERARLVESLGTQAYFGLMREAAVMIGNSSSGIIEAASFGLPVVNIGSRQDGRVRAANVIDTGYGEDEIRAAVERALSADFRAGLADLQNPYDHGDASEIIVDVLRDLPLDHRLTAKEFVDLPAAC